MLPKVRKRGVAPPGNICEYIHLLGIYTCKLTCPCLVLHSRGGHPHRPAYLPNFEIRSLTLFKCMSIGAPNWCTLWAMCVFAYVSTYIYIYCELRVAGIFWQGRACGNVFMALRARSWFLKSCVFPVLVRHQRHQAASRVGRMWARNEGMG